MWSALERAWHVAPPDRLDALRMPRATIALHCVKPGCAQCADFDAHYRAADVATKLRDTHGVDGVVRWDCAHAAARDVALESGADALPCFVIVPPKGHAVRVVEPRDVGMPT